MEAYKVETILKQSGTLVLNQLPFKIGDHVEVIVVRVSESTRDVLASESPLRGTVLRYDDPFVPVAESEVYAC